jgi:hypothetical protein
MAWIVSPIFCGGASNEIDTTTPSYIIHFISTFLTKILIQQNENNDPAETETASATAKSINNRRRKPSNGSRVQDKQEVLDSNDLFYCRDVTLAVPTLNNNGNSNKLLFRSIRRHRHHPKQRSSAVNEIHRFRLYVLPTPPRQFLDKTFAGLVVRHEQTLLQKQTLTAWMATLGGGYFFCKQLSKSLRLARQQRFIASQIGNESMVRHCLLNEAYNLIYAGSFLEANNVLSTLERMVISNASSRTTQILEEHDIERTLRQCDAARIFMRRLKNCPLGYPNIVSTAVPKNTPKMTINVYGLWKYHRRRRRHHHRCRRHRD